MKQKLELKVIQEKDLERIMYWRMSPDVTKYMFKDLDLTLEDQKRWFDKIKNDKSCKHWVIRYDGNDIGVLGLIDIDHYNKRCSWLGVVHGMRRLPVCLRQGFD